MGGISFGEGRKGSFVFNKGMSKHYLAVSIIYLAITLFMFWPLTKAFATTNIKYTDVYQTMWGLWWVRYATFTLHTSIYSTKLLYYPLGASLATETFSPIAALAASPLQSVSVAFEYNSLLVISFVLAGLFAFMLVYYLVGNKYAAFVGGLIFAFSPMHIAQSYGHLNWTMIEWVPIFLLLVLISLNERKHIYMIGAAVAFVLVAFAGDIEQAMVAVLFVLFILIYAAFKDRERMLNMATFKVLAEMAVLAILISLPFSYPLAVSTLQSKALSAQNNILPIGYSVAWSNNLLSFLLPSLYNGLFTGIALKYYSVIYDGWIEGISYIGYSVLFLSIAGLVLYKRQKPKEKDGISLWLWAAVFFGWMSTGPVLLVYHYLTPIPGPFFVYFYIPILNIIREPGRFDMLVTICLSVLAGFGLVALFNRVSKGKHKSRKELAIALLFTALILIEYNGAPTPYLSRLLYANATIPSGYNAIGAVKGNYSVLILPDSRPTNDSMSMYYQTLFKKPIVGGYTTRLNNTDYAIIASMPFSRVSANPSMLSGMNFSSQYMQNYSNAQLRQLYEYRVSVVVLNEGYYNSTGNGELIAYLTYLFGKPIYKDNSTVLFYSENQ